MLGGSGGVLVESVLEAAGHALHVAHATSTLGASALGLSTPVD